MIVHFSFFFIFPFFSFFPFFPFFSFFHFFIFFVHFFILSFLSFFSFFSLFFVDQVRGNPSLRLKVPRKTFEAITLKTDDADDAETGFDQSDCPANDILRNVKEDHGHESI